jgi:trehalose utilization protein
VQRVIANGIRWAKPQEGNQITPRHVPIEQAREHIVAHGGTVHIGDGQLKKP